MEKAFHINISKEDLQGATTVILPGDPGRVPKIAGYLDSSEEVSLNREYNVMVGKLGDQTIGISRFNDPS